MRDVRFAVNLRRETISPSFRRRSRASSFLVAPAYLTRALRKEVVGLAGQPLMRVVDNGNFDDISRIAASHSAQSQALKQRLADVQARLERGVRWVDLSRALRGEVKALSDDLGRAATRAAGMSLTEQLTLAPTAVIGIEDITAALWLRSGLDVAALGPAVRTLRGRNARVAEIAQRMRSSIPAGADIEYLPVASALDYGSALAAGKAFAEAGLEGAAMGFGAFMTDDWFTSRVVLKGRIVNLPGPLPMRYLRCALVARGFWDGWKEVTGGAPRRFHFLGLGAPVMMAVVAVAARHTAALSFDAVSPIKDAVEGTIYSHKPALIKIRSRQVAVRLASGGLRAWTCPCPFCAAFKRMHPFDYSKGRRWGRSNGPEVSVRAADLQPGGGLFAAYPLLAEPGSGALRREVSFARSGHNHWVLENVVADMRKHGRTSAGLIEHVERVVAAYRKATKVKHFGDAVAMSFAIARGELG